MRSMRHEPTTPDSTRPRTTTAHRDPLAPDLPDADTHGGLRAALTLVAAQGWECPAGRAVLAALAARAPGWGRGVLRGRSTGRGPVPPDEVLSVAWLTLHRFSANIAAADAPWAYLWTAVQNALV